MSAQAGAPAPIHQVGVDGAVRIVATDQIIGWVTRATRRTGQGMVLSWKARYRLSGTKAYYSTRKAAVEDLLAQWRLTEASILAARTENTTENTTTSKLRSL